MSERFGVVFVVCFIFSSSLIAAPGDRDPSFGVQGIVKTDFGPEVDAISKIALQSDGKIIAVGRSHVPGAMSDWAVARYLPDGKLDTSFGQGGKATVQIGLRRGRASAVTVQPDGKIVVAGWGRPVNNNDVVVIRLLPNGALDSSFGQGGIVSTAVSKNHDYARSVSVLPDGKILVVGSYVYRFQNGIKYYNLLLIRYLPNGQLDTEYNGTGYAINYLGRDYNTKGFEALVDKQGGTIVVGRTRNPLFFHNNMIVARHLPSGPQDTNFGNADPKPGVSSFDLGPGPDEAWAVSLQEDGKILVGGGVHDNIKFDTAVMRLKTNGTKDRDFGVNGVARFKAATGDDLIREIVQQEDGKIIGVGYGIDGEKSQWVVARYLNSGQLDTTFAPSSPTPGVLKFSVGAKWDKAFGAVLQEGKLVIAGESGNADDKGSFALVRLLLS